MPWLKIVCLELYASAQFIIIIVMCDTNFLVIFIYLIPEKTDTTPRCTKKMSLLDIIVGDGAGY